MQVVEHSIRKIMRCRICFQKFSDVDSENLIFFPDTGICFNCYQKGKLQPSSAWCFGKEDSKEHRGFNPYRVGNLFCSVWCPDKRYCPLFASGEIYRLRKLAKVV